MTSKPCPPSINKIPVCCEYYEPSSSEYESEPCEGAEEEEYEEIEGANARGHTVKRHCRKVPKKRLKPCIKRSQIPGARPLQHFEEKRPCRKLHPKPCKRYRRNKQMGNETYSDDEGKLGEEEEEEEEEEEGDEGDEGDEGECRDSESGNGFGDNYEKEGSEKRSEHERSEPERSETENADDGLYNEEGELFGSKRPCRKRKKKMKKFPCKVTKVAFPEDESPLFPSLPMPNLGEKPPVQKFPPAEDKDSVDKKRVFPCGRKKKKLKPCKRRGGSSSSGSGSTSTSDCTISSSDED